MAAAAETLTHEVNVRELLAALTALKRGDFSVRLPDEWSGMAGKVADTFNAVVELNARMADELERLSRVVGHEGRIRERASLGEVTGSWAESVQSVNTLIGDLVHPVDVLSKVVERHDLMRAERRRRPAATARTRPRVQ